MQAAETPSLVDKGWQTASTAAPKRRPRDRFRNKQRASPKKICAIISRNETQTPEDASTARKDTHKEAPRDVDHKDNDKHNTHQDGSHASHRDGPHRDTSRRDGPHRDGLHRDGPYPHREGPHPHRDGPHPHRDGPHRDGPHRDGPHRAHVNRSGSGNRNSANRQSSHRDLTNRDLGSKDPALSQTLSVNPVRLSGWAAKVRGEVAKGSVDEDASTKETSSSTVSRPAAAQESSVAPVNGGHSVKEGGAKSHGRSKNGSFSVRTASEEASSRAEEKPALTLKRPVTIKTRKSDSPLPDAPTPAPTPVEDGLERALKPAEILTQAVSHVRARREDLAAAAQSFGCFEPHHPFGFEPAMNGASMTQQQLLAQQMPPHIAHQQQMAHAQHMAQQLPHQQMAHPSMTPQSMPQHPMPQQPMPHHPMPHQSLPHHPMPHQSVPQHPMTPMLSHSSLMSHQVGHLPHLAQQMSPSPMGVAYEQSLPEDGPTLPAHVPRPGSLPGIQFGHYQPLMMASYYPQYQMPYGYMARSSYYMWPAVEENSSSKRFDSR